MFPGATTETQEPDTQKTIYTTFEGISCPYQESIKEEPMPRVHRKIIECAVYIYPGEEDSIVGRPRSGVGVIIAIPRENASNPLSDPHLFIVTCRHIAENEYPPAIRYNTDEGELKFPQFAGHLIKTYLIEQHFLHTGLD
jgi:hypothetical protein